MSGETDHWAEDWAAAKVAAEAAERGEPAPASKTETKPVPAETAETVEDEGKPKKGTEGKATPADHFELRKMKRELRAQVERERQEVHSRAEQLKPFIEAARHAEAGDWEEAIKAFSGRDFKTVAEEVIKKSQGVDLKTQREVERLRLEREQERKQQEQLATQQRQQQQIALAKQWAQENIAAPLASDESTKALAEDEMFVQAVFQTIRASYDVDTGERMPLETAVQQARERFQGIYDRLAKLLGHQQTQSAEALQGATDRTGEMSAKPRARARTVPNSRATGVSAASPPKFENDQEWLTWATGEMKKARAAEEAGKP